MREQRAVKPGQFLRSHWVKRARFPMYAAPQQAGNAGRANPLGLNRAELGHWPVVPADDHNITLFDLIQIMRQVSLRFLNIDFCHADFSLADIMVRIPVRISVRSQIWNDSQRLHSGNRHDFV